MTRQVSRRRCPAFALVALTIAALVLLPLQFAARAADQKVPDDTLGTPEATSNAAGRLDLAAIVPTFDDLPDGAFLVRASYFSPKQLADTFFLGDPGLTRQVEDTGLQTWYQIRYGTSGTTLTLDAYVELYPDAASAENGFAFFEDEGEGQESEDVDVPGVDGDDEELTITDAEPVPGVHYQRYDATVRKDNVIVGFAIDNSGGPNTVDQATVENLILVMVDRLDAVLAGENPPGTDLSLPSSLLTSSLDDPITIEGYVSAGEVIPAGIDAAADAFNGGYARTLGLRFVNAPDSSPVLFANLTLLSFENAMAAEQALYALDALTIPSPLPPAGDSLRQQGDVEGIPGVDNWQATWRAFLPGGPIDSVRLGFTVGDHLGIVEVAGAASVYAAQDAATEIATAQAACLNDGGACAAAFPAADIRDLALVEANAPEPIDGADPDRQAIFDDVWNTINDLYLYRTGRQNILFPNFHELDWGAVREEYEGQALNAATDEEFYGIVSEMVAELSDQHTGYLSPDDAGADDALFAGEPVYLGIGALLAGNLDPSTPGLILDVFPGSPAENAGLARRDRIEAVNGDPLPLDDFEALGPILEEISTFVAPDDVPGDLGGPITLTVRSPGSAPRDVVLDRDSGPAPILPTGMRLPQAANVGYLQIPAFVTPDLNERVVEILNDVLDAGPLDGLIIDLRANPGGAVQLMQSVLGQFVDGEVGHFSYRDGQMPEPIVVPAGELRDALRDVPLVVLTDDRMYSAAEVGTAILQSQGRATVVGVTSPGDVEVLSPFDFPDGSRLYLVLGVFGLPGQAVEGHGITPDIPVLLDWIQYPFEQDPQILTAIDVLEGTQASPSATPAA